MCYYCNSLYYCKSLLNFSLLNKTSSCFVLLLRQGLGKNSEGRVEPIKIEILPPGKSLDACAAIREEKKMAPSQKRKRNRGRSRRLKLAKANEEKVCVNVM